MPSSQRGSSEATLPSRQAMRAPLGGFLTPCGWNLTARRLPTLFPAWNAPLHVTRHHQALASFAGAEQASCQYVWELTLAACASPPMSPGGLAGR